MLVLLWPVHQGAVDDAKSNRIGFKQRGLRLMAVVRGWRREAASSFGCAVAGRKVSLR